MEIYRIGGEDVPRPSEAGVNFHQLSWSDLEAEQSLDAKALAAGTLRPIFLTPTTNIALTSTERRGGPYVRVSGVASYSITDLSKNMIDADLGTFWEWVEGIQSRFTGQRYLETRRVTMDLGGLFFVNRVRVVAAESGLYPDKLDVTADLGVQKKDNVSGYGAARIGGQLVFELAENVQDTIDVRFPPALARSVGLLLYRASPKALHIGEVGGLWRRLRTPSSVRRPVYRPRRAGRVGQHPLARPQGSPRSRLDPIAGRERPRSKRVLAIDRPGR